jgi:hypothetical protein
LADNSRHGEAIIGFKYRPDELAYSDTQSRRARRSVLICCSIMSTAEMLSQRNGRVLYAATYPMSFRLRKAQFPRLHRQQTPATAPPALVTTYLI